MMTKRNSDRADVYTRLTQKIIANLENWDTSLGTNSPGQSGNPDSHHYSDLFRMWLKGKYFPIFFSKDKVLSAAELVTNLQPDE